MVKYAKKGSIEIKTHKEALSVYASKRRQKNNFKK